MRIPRCRGSIGGVKKKTGAAEHAIFFLSSSGTPTFLYVVAHSMVTNRSRAIGHGRWGDNNRFGAYH